ncbi:MAG: nucleotidyltransferase substrate binding protein [Spirochaetaceae bacterium]|jgi:nucleotidyltransferase substrate binding protein (TIGR01987 family)|nr:nucleotidyltransferase substrate binding protein [Spirochaetaceae bacterium]
MPIDFSPFEKALSSLKEAVSVFDRDKTNTIVRDSVIQRYEYTYEMAYKMLRRFLLEAESSRQQVEEMFFADIIRTANARGLLLRDLAQWNRYRRMRNLTSHTYDEFSADSVVSIIPDFIEDADFLYAKIAGRTVLPGDSV